MRRSLTGFACSLVWMCLHVVNLPSVQGQVKEVVVGITPTCPYGLTGCWGGAAEGLARLPGVDSVAKAPDAYNSTASVYLDSRDKLPDVDRWQAQFATVTNQAYGFRGVEVTIEAELVATADQLGLVIRSEATPPSEDIKLKMLPLQHKLQWNFRKGAARQPEPDEASAYELLRALHKSSKASGMRVIVTGPLVKDKDQNKESTNGPKAIEVREFFLIKVMRN